MPTGTGLDAIVDAINADTGLKARISAADIAGGAAAAETLNQMIAQAIVDTGAGADGLIDIDDVVAINAWFKADPAREAAFHAAHGDDERGVETGFHLVQNDGATTLFRGRNAINKVADGLYHIGFDIADGRLVNEDGAANAPLTFVADWLNYFYFGNALITGTESADVLASGRSTDPFLASIDEHFDARGGDDKVFGNVGNDTADGGEGADTLFGGDANDSLMGEAGDDFLMGVDDADTLLGGDGDDLAFGGSDADSLDGGAGADILFGGDASDTIAGGDGSDALIGESGDDRLDAGAGDDFLIAHEGADTLDAGDGADGLVGGAGADSLSGGAGNDVLFGEDGEDVLVGGAGVDVYVGGDGADLFVLGDAQAAGGFDWIGDFAVGDRIQLDVAQQAATQIVDLWGGTLIFVQSDPAAAYAAFVAGVNAQTVQAGVVYA